MAGGGMDDDAGGLVQHEQRFILEQNLKRDFLGQGFRRTGFGPTDGDLFAGARGMGGLGGLAVDADITRFDEALHGAARDGGELGACRKVSSRRPGCDCSTVNFSDLERAWVSVRRGLGDAIAAPVDEHDEGDAGADGGVRRR